MEHLTELLLSLPHLQKGRKEKSNAQNQKRTPATSRVS